MATSEALKKDIAKVLEILEYQYDTNGRSNILHILNKDFARFEISIETFAVTLAHLTERYPEIYAEHVYDFVNGEPLEEQWIDPALYTMARIKVPTKFNELMIQIRNEVIPRVTQENSNTFFNFHLTKDGKLWKEVNGKRQEHSFQEGRLSHHILKQLSGSHFKSTSKIAIAVKCTEAQVRSTINGIKRKVRLHFPPLQGKDFVTGRRGSGYKLGKDVRILPEH